MSMPAAPTLPRGLSFDIPEHMAIRAWAEFQQFKVVTEIDRVIGGEEYEEVIAFYDNDSTWRRMTFWRAEGAVVVEPMSGPARRFASIWDAIDAATFIIRSVAVPAPITPRMRRPSLRRQ